MNGQDSSSHVANPPVDDKNEGSATQDEAAESGPSKATESTEIKLRKQLTLWSGIGIIVGSTIGSGIFVSPTGVLIYSGSVGLSLLVWLFTGIMSLIGAHCITELGTMIPKSGGLYVYLLESYGELMAFLYLWTTLILTRPLGFVVLSITFANYILEPLFQNCDTLPDAAVRLVGALCLGFLTWLNCFSTRWAVMVQDYFSLAKVLVLIVLGVLGGYFLLKGHTDNYQEPFAGSNWSFASLATAYYQGYFAFSGWYNLNSVTEEMKNASRDIPRAVWISVSVVTVVYLVANMTYFVLLTPEEILSSNAVAMSFGTKIYDGLGWIISVLVASSVFGAIDSSIISTSRIAFSGAREGHFPECLALINLEKLNPMAAILFVGGLSACLLVYPEVTMLITYHGFSESIFILLSIGSLLWFRYKRPDLHRPIKVWIGFPIIYISFSLVILALPIMVNPIGLGITIGIVATGIPVYFLCIGWPKSRDKCRAFSAKLTKLIQKVTNSSLETSR